MISAPYTALQRYMEAGNLINIAIDKKTKQSSYFNSSRLNDLAVTGELPNDFAFHTDEDAEPWWEIDLAIDYPLEIIALHNRRDLCEYRAQAVEIYISTDEETWICLHKGFVYFTNSEDGIPFILPLMGTIQARYIRVALPHAGYLHLSQIEIFAKKREVALRRILAISDTRAANPTGTRIGIMGTSNSLMTRGYVSHLTAFANISSIENMSLGSSHPTVVPFRLSQDKIANCDILIVDLCVNEQYAIYKNAYNHNITGIVFSYILEICSKYNIIPLILLMPESNSFENSDPKAFQARNYYRALCQSHSVPFFDGYSMVDFLSRLSSYPPGTFFQDPFHLSERYAAYLGKVLGMIADDLPKKVKLKSTQRISSDLNYVPVELFAGDLMQVQTRASSIISVRTTFIKSGEELAVKVPSGSEIIGLVINMANSNSTLTVIGDQTVTKNLNNTYYEGAHQTWIVCWSLISPVSVSNDIVRIVCDDLFFRSESGRYQEINDHGNIPPCKLEKEVGVELGGLVVRRVAALKPSALVDEVEIDLWNAWEQSIDVEVF